MPLRNLPVDKAAPLAQLLSIKPGQVSSMGLAKDTPLDMTLLAFAAKESVSEEEYFGDTLYYVLEGAAVVVFPEDKKVVRTGEVLMVPAHTEHAVEGLEGGAFKLLQITL